LHQEFALQWDIAIQVIDFANMKSSIKGGLQGVGLMCSLSNRTLGMEAEHEDFVHHMPLPLIVLE
jgi:hypothetical protein